MTDLDRKIAEAKGWRYSPFGEEKERNSSTGQVFPMSEGFVYVQGESTYHVAGWACNWSTDTAKAFELVDELTGASTNVVFQLTQGQVTRQWQASFICLAPRHRVNGEAPTVPEAICQAYIALKEWEKKR